MLRVLQCFRFGERWVTYQEITRRTQLPKATVSRLAFTLTELGFLHHNPANGEYALSAGGLTLSFKVLSSMEIAQVARPVLDDLAEYSQAAVSLGVRHRVEMVYLAHSRGQARLTLGLDVGARIPLHSTSMGRALLCALHPAARLRIHDALAGAVVNLGDGREPYAINIGGPVSRLTPELLMNDLGPRLVEATERIKELVVGDT